MNTTASPARRPRLLLLALLLVPCAGCLDFEKETVVVAFPKDRDEVRFLLVYEGFRVAGEGNGPMDKAKEELAKLTTTDKFFYLGSPLLAIPLDKQKDEKEDQKRYREWLVKHLTVGKCVLFTNKEGKLCGYQKITLRNAKKFVADVNGFLSEEFAKWAQDLLDNEKKRGKDWDKETLDLVLKAARNKHQWVRIEPGRISFTMPGSQAVFTKAKREILAAQRLEDLCKELAPGKKEPKLDAIRDKLKSMELGQAWLSDLPVSIDLRKDRATLSLGFGDGEPFMLISPPPDKPKEFTERDKGLAAYAKTLKAEFRKDVTTDALIAEFLKEVKKAK
jgi:hypothetical protein